MRQNIRFVWLATFCALAIGVLIFKSSTITSPATQKLHQQLADVTEVRIFPSGLAVSPKPLFLLHGTKAKEFAQALRLKEKSNTNYFTCACYGTHKFDFYRSGTKIGSFYYKDQKTLHSNDGLWQGDLPLTWQSRRYLQSILNE